MSNHYKNEQDDELDPKQLFETYHTEQTEDEYIEMVLSDLGTDEASQNEQYNHKNINEKKANYMNPTMASVLPPYLYSEIERVKNSYRTGSYNTIKKLPTRLQPGQIRQTRKQNITENLLMNSQNIFKPVSKKNEPFHRPEYIGTDFDKMKNLHKYLMDEEKIQTDSLSRKPFVVTSRIRSKTEDIFFDPEYQFPGMGPGTGLKRLESMVRDNSNDDKIILEPGYVLQNKLNVGSGLVVKNWIECIHAQLVNDWPLYQFRVKFTKSNELLIQFIKPNYINILQNTTNNTTNSHNSQNPDNNSYNSPNPGPLNVPFPPPNNALNKYMHYLASHGLCSEYKLKKRGDRWNIYEVEYINQNGSLDGTIPTYGADVNKPHIAALRQSTGDYNCLIGIGGMGSSSNKYIGGSSSKYSNSNSSSSIKATNKTVHWYTKSSKHNNNNTNTNTTTNNNDNNMGFINNNMGFNSHSSSNPSTPIKKPIENTIKPTILPPPEHGILINSNEKIQKKKEIRLHSSSSNDNEEGVRTMDEEGVRTMEVDIVRTMDGEGVRTMEGDIVRTMEGEQTRGRTTSEEQDIRVRTIPSTVDSIVRTQPPRPPPITTTPSLQQHLQNTEQNTEANKVYYLTYAFYAPWVHTSNMNVKRSMGYSNRVKAKKYSDYYHNRYSLTGNNQSTTDTINNTTIIQNNNTTTSSNSNIDLTGSIKSDGTNLSSPQAAANRFMNGFLRDAKYNK